MCYITFWKIYIIHTFSIKFSGVGMQPEVLIIKLLQTGNGTGHFQDPFKQGTPVIVF
jgi:hypothetical protein